jgi:hypothetical protein
MMQQEQDRIRVRLETLMEHLNSPSLEFSRLGNPEIESTGGKETATPTSGKAEKSLSLIEKVK